jgi:arylsulfatase A-like enzyme
VNRRTFLVKSGLVAAGAATAFLGWDAARGAFDQPGVRRYGDLKLRRARAKSDMPNVLFIAIDDLNDWVGFLNDHPGTLTPNMDALASKSVVFTNAYCAAPICRAARTALMFGRAPYKTGVYDNNSTASYDKMAAVNPALTDDFWAAGYDVVGAGKVFHGSEHRRWTQYSATPFYVSDLDRRTSPPDRYDPKWLSPYDGKPIGDGRRAKAAMIDFGPSGRSPDRDPDGQATTWVRARLAEKHDRPFFLAQGFVEPHEPWRVPQKFFDLHPLDGVVVPPTLPHELESISPYARDHFVDPYGVLKLLRDDHLLARAIQAYQAAITFVDDRIGLLLHDLASSRYADNTIIVLWSDNAYHLGEKQTIEKATLWEPATHVPLLVSAPGRLPARRFEPAVSTLDVSPTVAELCGVRQHGRDLDCESLLPRLANPRLADARPAITTWLAGNHAVRLGPWRYISYRTGETELYDHRTDPGENTNLAGRADHAAIEHKLAAYVPPRR